MDKYMLPKIVVSFQHDDITVRLLEPDTSKKIIQSQSQQFLKTKDSQVFRRRTNNMHKFNGCCLRGPVSSNGFKVFNGCIVEP